MEDQAVDVVEWPGVEKLNQAQDILDRNRFLINEINNNHRLRTPEALARNVVLIRELNGNIAKVVNLYRELASQAPPSQATPPPARQLQ